MALQRQLATGQFRVSHFLSAAEDIEGVVGMPRRPLHLSPCAICALSWGGIAKTIPATVPDPSSTAQDGHRTPLVHRRPSWLSADLRPAFRRCWHHLWPTGHRPLAVLSAVHRRPGASGRRRETATETARGLGHPVPLPIPRIVRWQPPDHSVAGLSRAHASTPLRRLDSVFRSRGGSRARMRVPPTRMPSVIPPSNPRKDQLKPRPRQRTIQPPPHAEW